MRLGEAIERYAQEAGPKPAARVRRYFEWLGTVHGANSDTVFARFLHHLQEEGLAPGTVDLYARTVRAFFRRFGLQPPRVKGPRLDPFKDQKRPALEWELIARMIRAARAGDVTNRQASLLALATTYGLRAGELAAIRVADVDLPGERIYIRTLKGGRPRWCWVPPEIVPYLEGVWAPSNPNAVEKVFDNLWGAVMDTKKPERTNWHSVRRALVRDLITAGVPESAVARFLRWSSGSGRGPERMVALYARPSEYVGAEGVTPAREEDEGRREYDALVWDLHPYLSLWRDEASDRLKGTGSP